MKKVYFSNRIYKQSLTKKYDKAISHALLVFNQAKHFCFQLQVKEKRSGQSLRSESMHKTVKSKYNLKDYYANSVVQEANALMSSQQELKNLYISNRTEHKSFNVHPNTVRCLKGYGDYYIFKCIVDVPENKSENFSKSAGMIGVDLNVDHIAWSNVNSIGQLIKSGTLNFSLEGKTSGQITKLIEIEAIALVDIAVRCNKPISLEKLDTTKSKVSGAYGNKKANRKMSMFAYKKLILAIKSRAEKMGVTVFDINPAYTSQIGIMKYMKRFGISIHEAASYVIARRAMGYKEKLPPVLHSLLPEKITSLHHWAQWGKVSTLLKSIRTKNYYQSELLDRRQFRETGLLFCCALSDDETKALSKLNK
ncbi:MAG: IS200/IS605 family accessory protein TnpB-related protein [Bacillota bacterium]